MEVQNQQIETLHDLFVKIISKKEEFPIDFDEAWQWIGYFKKQDAVEMLENNFKEKVDYLRLGVKNTGKKGRPADHINLSVDCFKAFCMLAQTDKGKEVRLYYLQLEKDVAILGAFGASQKYYGADARRQLADELKADKELSTSYRKKLDNISDFKEWMEVENRITKNKKLQRRMTNEVATQLTVGF